MIDLYVKFACPILTRQMSEFQLIPENHLWVKKKCYPLTAKAVSDIIARTISCGDFDGYVMSHSIRSTLAKQEECVHLNNLDHPALNYVNTELCQKLRHSVSVHQNIYVQNNSSLQNVRAAKFLSKVNQNQHITAQDISSLAEENICKSVVPSFNKAPDRTYMSNDTMQTPRGYDPSSKKKQIYQLIKDLGAGYFTINSDMSAKNLKNRLSENPHLHRNIQDNLDLANLKNMKSLLQRCITFRKNLERRL